MSSKSYRHAKRQRCPRKWTSSEDAALKAAIGTDADPNWIECSQMVPNRSPAQCQQRWNNVLKPGLRKGPWTDAEDSQLLSLIVSSLKKLALADSHCSNEIVSKCTSAKHPSFAAFVRETERCKLVWGDISEGVPGRTPKQCRERWVNNLNPLIRRDPWTPEEDRILRDLYLQHPRKWALIATGLPGRTENFVKNRHKSLALDKICVSDSTIPATQSRKATTLVTKTPSPTKRKETPNKIAVKPKRSRQSRNVSKTHEEEELPQEAAKQVKLSASAALFEGSKLQPVESFKLSQPKPMSRQLSHGSVALDSILVDFHHDPVDLDLGYESHNPSGLDDASTVWSSPSPDHTASLELSDNFRYSLFPQLQDDALFAQQSPLWS